MSVQRRQAHPNGAELYDRLSKCVTGLAELRLSPLEVEKTNSKSSAAGAAPLGLVHASLQLITQTMPSEPLNEHCDAKATLRQVLDYRENNRREVLFGVFLTKHPGPTS